ncbi:hypothetical protein ACJJIR_15070 [Microbulbifer sp. SSSA008]|uniref:hypothetical protein n=1 Tax=Microbulbifer sp. SSSA008 TaxID=3243380 RepID=UPI004039F118
MRVKDAYKEMWQFQSLLLEDIRAARDIARNDPTPFSLRTIYRTSAAYIEGTLYQLRLVCLAALEDVPTIFNYQEILALKEKTVLLNSKGKLEEKDQFQKLKPSILFLFSCFAKLHSIHFSPNISDHRWDSLGKFFELRNSLMHPKSISDFEIDEFKNTVSLEAVSWFNENLQKLFRECESAEAAASVST